MGNVCVYIVFIIFPLCAPVLAGGCHLEKREREAHAIAVYDFCCNDILRNQFGVAGPLTALIHKEMILPRGQRELSSGYWGSPALLCVPMGTRPAWRAIIRLNKYGPHNSFHACGQPREKKRLLVNIALDALSQLCH